jgi:hypothetical protein
MSQRPCWDESGCKASNPESLYSVSPSPPTRAQNPLGGAGGQWDIWSPRKTMVPLAAGLESTGAEMDGGSLSLSPVGEVLESGFEILSAGDSSR